MTTPRNLTMIGTGYVGLVSGTCFAEMGFNVTCMDVDAKKIEALKAKGTIPIYEPGLKELVDKNVAAGRLHFTTDLASCVPNSDLVFIGVGTPQDEDGSADLRHVESAARAIAPHLKDYTVVVNKSTVPVGTGMMVENWIKEVNPSADFDVASNPEFLREGEAVDDFLEPDRVVVGVQSGRAADMLRALYKPLTDEGAAMLVTNRASSELIKYASNAFLATKITFINELIALCDKVGADILQVSKGMGMDSRIAPRFLHPGPGYGGSCFPKDTNALAKTAKDYGVNLSLVETTIEANQRIKEEMTGRIKAALDNSVKGKRIAVLGLAFKANTDDMRDASALTILPQLKADGADVVAFDPEAMPRAKELMPELSYAKTLWECVENADAVVVLTDWADFKAVSLETMAQKLKGKNLIDLRNIYNAKDVAQAGLRYVSLGRP